MKRLQKWQKPGEGYPTSGFSDVGSYFVLISHNKNMLVLASASPRRKELLAQAGFIFTIAPAAIPEDPMPDESPIAYVVRLAREKAQAVYAQLSAQNNEDDPLLVLGADTTVVAPDGEILGKPSDPADAARMLHLLSGVTHQVITGVALVTQASTETAAEVTRVTMLTLSEAEIAAYIATCEPEVWANAWAGILPWGQTEGVDWCIGRKLPAMVNALGLGYPEAKTEVPDIRGTTRDAVYFQMFFEMVRDRLADSGLVDSETLDAASAMLADPDYWTQCWMLTSVWVRKQQVAISNP